MSKPSRRERKKRKGIYQPSLFERRRGGQPGNTNAVKHGLYSSRFFPEEIEALGEMQDGVKDEIELVRVTTARILRYVEQKTIEGEIVVMDPEDYVAILNLIAKNSATVARLMQVDKALKDAQNAGIGAQLLAALEEVNASLLEREQD